MARCDDLATQLIGLQNQLSDLQNQLSDLQSQLSDLEYQRTHPNEACADQGLKGIDCELYLRGLGPQIRSTESQIAGVQGQIAGVQGQITNVQQQQQKYWCSLVLGSDGTPLTITTDDQGYVTAAQAVGTDGVKRSFRCTSSFNQNKLGWYYTVMRQEFFENDQRYLYVTTWIYLWGRKISVSMSGGGKDYGLSINFPDDGSHDSAPITIASGAMGQLFIVTQSTLYLNQGSISAPSITGDLALPPEIAQLFSKITYFQHLFDREKEQNAAQEASDLQAAGIDPNMTPNQALYGQGASKAAMTLRPAGQGTKALAIGLCAVAGGTAGILAGAAVVGATSATGPAAGLWGAAAGVLVKEGVNGVCKWYVESKDWSDPGPPPPPPDPASPMTPMPPDASVPIDGGDLMSPGGDPGGQCIGPPVTTEQGVEVAKLSAKQRVIVPFDDFVCV